MHPFMQLSPLPRTPWPKQMNMEKKKEKKIMGKCRLGHSSKKRRKQKTTNAERKKEKSTNPCPTPRFLSLRVSHKLIPRNPIPLFFPVSFICSHRKDGSQ